MAGFTIEEAEKLLPEVGILVEEAVSVYRELQECYSKALRVDYVSEDSDMVTRDMPLKTQKKIRVLTEELDDVIEEITEIGVELDDLEVGVVSFPAEFENRTVFLCWQLGHSKIEFWHEVDEDFSMRKRILRLD